MYDGRTLHVKYIFTGPRMAVDVRLLQSPAMAGNTRGKALPKSKRRPTFIRAWRKHRLLSLQQLAERVGTTHATVSRIERGLMDYDGDFLSLVADALQCDVPDLLVRDPSDPDGIWTIWDNAKPGERRQIVQLGKVVIGG